jgi:DNA-binding XRE family transcriptional regulator
VCSVTAVRGSNPTNICSTSFEVAEGYNHNFSLVGQNGWLGSGSGGSQVANLLKEEREKRDLSLNLLAEKAGLSRQTVSYMEQGLQGPVLDTLLRINRALGVDLEKIIARAWKPASQS